MVPTILIYGRKVPMLDEDSLSKSHPEPHEPQAQVVRISTKSCVNCNRRKKKCDRILPKCTSCVTRGVECSYNSKRKRCLACAKAKYRCSKEFPKCRRCISRGVECKYPSLYDETKGKPVKSGCYGTKQVLAVQSLKRKQEQLNPHEQCAPSQSLSLTQNQTRSLVERNHNFEISSSCKDYSKGPQYASLGLQGLDVKKNLDDKCGGDVLSFKMPPYTFPLYKAPQNPVFQTDCSTEKANGYYGKLMNKQNEPEWKLCSQMEENQYQLQAQNFVSTGNPKQVLCGQSLKMKQALLYAPETKCCPSPSPPCDQTQTSSLSEIMNHGIELSSKCKDYLKNHEQASPVHQQDVGGGLTDSHLQKSQGDKCSGEVFSSVIQSPFSTDQLYGATLNPVFLTDNYRQQQATKKHCGSQEFSMGKSSISRASSDLSLEEGASSVQKYVNGQVILSPESPLPSYTQLPAENIMIGSKFHLFLAAFIRRYASSHSFMVDLDGIQKAINRAFFSGPQGITSLFEVPTDRSITLDEIHDRARHTGILAAVGLGSIQLWFLDKKMHELCYNLIWQLLECCAEQVTEEVIFAHGVAAMYCKLTNNMTGLLRHLQFFNQLVERCETQLEGRIQSFHSFFALWGSLDSNQIECDKYTWQLIAKKSFFCNFEKDFPLMHNAMLQAPNILSKQQQHLLENYLRHIPSQNLQVLTLPTVSWVRRLLINEHTSDDFKTKALQEVLNFVGLASKFYNANGQIAPAVICYLLSTQAFLLLLAGRCSEAKEVLGKQVQMYINDPLLCAFLLTTNMVHQAHFLCMALSTLEMYESYRMFQQKVNAMAEFLRTQHLPIEPPISNHGLCDEPECMLLWNRLTIPDVPKFSKEVLNPELWEFDG